MEVKNDFELIIILNDSLTQKLRLGYGYKFFHMITEPIYYSQLCVVPRSFLVVILPLNYAKC